AIASRAATTQVARIPPKPGQRYNDPWLRGITLATSVHYTMNITVYGKLDVRQVRMMMIKPVTSVPMAFGSDAYDGMQTTRFAGSAVTLLPTGSQPAARRRDRLTLTPGARQANTPRTIPNAVALNSNNTPVAFNGSPITFTGAVAQSNAPLVLATNTTTFAGAVSGNVPLTLSSIPVP